MRAATSASAKETFAEQHGAFMGQSSGMLVDRCSEP